VLMCRVLCHVCRGTKEKAEDRGFLGCYLRRLVKNRDAFIFEASDFFWLMLGPEEEGTTILRNVHVLPVDTA
jgi:hypothetical protein